jgi:DNA-binding HxlR family transcriptional regulator
MSSVHDRTDRVRQVDAAARARPREGTSRFCELERSLAGISPRTLSLRLRALEEEGIVERHTFPEVPPRVEYALTEKGRALLPIIDDMRAYGEDWLGAECAELPDASALAIA